MAPTIPHLDLHSGQLPPNLDVSLPVRTPPGSAAVLQGGRRASFLPALRTQHAPRSQSRALEEDEDRRSWTARDGTPERGFRKPASTDISLDEPLSLLALEDWHRVHLERPGHQTSFKSQLLSCEAQLRKINQLALKMRSPNSVVTALTCDLLRSVFETLPEALHHLCLNLMGHIEEAVYSHEHETCEEYARLTQVFNHKMDRVPHFTIVRRQQAMLERLEKQDTEMQRLVDDHLARRRNVLEFIVRLQHEQRVVLQHWLFQFWVVTYTHRRSRIEKMAQVVLTTPQDITTPFVSWRLYVSQQRLEKAREECEAVDQMASRVANRITEVEIENEQQQRRLQDSLQVGAALKDKCAAEQQEHARLQRLWDATQPELLLSVLAQSLEFFYGLVIREARFSGLELRRRHAGCDATALQLGSNDPPVGDFTLDMILVRWANIALARARAVAEELLAASPGGAGSGSLEAVRAQPDIETLGEDLCDGTALCSVFVVLRAQRANKEVVETDFWPLDEQNLDLRATHTCSVLSHFAPTARARSLLSPDDIVFSRIRPLRTFLACVFLQEPLLPQLPPSLEPALVTSHRNMLESVLSRVEEATGGAAFDVLEDPTPLLRGSEDYHALATTSMEQVLLRWVKVQLGSAYGRAVENFGCDLQDGYAIGFLLQQVTPEFAPDPLPHDLEERLEQIVTACIRCTDFELLTVDAIIEGQSDMLAAFFAQLFLARRNLPARQDSLLSIHLRLLERVCTEGLEILHSPNRDNSQVMELCVQLEMKWPEITFAVQTVHEANKTMQALCDRMRTFMGDTLMHRARGNPRTMLDAKEAREFILYTTLNPDHTLGQITKDALLSTQSKVEELLKRHFRLLRDVFRYYASSGANQVAGISPEDFLRLYQDCKLRSRDLTPSHLEVIFLERLDAVPERTLSPQSFVEVLLQCAHLKFRGVINNLPDQLSWLIEHHLKQYACQDVESIFQRMAYDGKVRLVLQKHSKELKLIFQLYATMDMSTNEAMQRVNTMNIKEFHMLLEHCEIMDDVLTEGAMQQIFDGIQQSADMVEDGLDHEDLVDDMGDIGLGDDEELAFSEFVDGLVAIAAYKFPDPFTPFQQRVETFILQLFASLRGHWSRRRISPQVDSMLNALAKKCR